MSIWQKALGAVGLKLSKGEMRFSGRPMVFFDTPRISQHDMARDVGDGSTSDIVMTPVRWLQRSFNESRIAVYTDDEIVDDHELPALIENPNPFYAAEHLYAGTIFSLSTDGNAYWIKVADGFGEVAELWYVPHFLIDPKWPDDGTEFVSHYEYRVAGQNIRLEVDEVVHFRDGVDPQNMRKGLSPLKGLLREVWTDNEAAMFTASLLKNGGVPGAIISPKGENTEIDKPQLEQAEERFRQKFTGERRGNAMVMSLPMEVSTFGYNPKELDLSPLRDISEERVTAALGVPAAVVGFGAGLQQTKVGATMRELRQLAWQNGVIPLQQMIAREAERHLLPDFGGEGKVRFDNSDVSALAEDENSRAERVRGLVKDGIWTRGEGRTETGQEATPADDVFLMPFTAIEVPRNGRPEPDPIPPANPNDPEERSAGATAFKHRHTLLERIIEERAPKAKPSDRVSRFAAQMDALRLSLASPFEGELVEVFEQLGRQVERSARVVLPSVRSADGHETKRDAMIAQRIAVGIDFLGMEKALQTKYETHYLRVGTAAGKEFADFLALATGLPDPAARALLATGGRRAGLIDLTNKSKRVIFNSLIEGRTEGLAGENLARFIRENVERGPWSSPTVRARVIARTETAFATNSSVIEGAKHIAGVEMMMLHDGRAGETDELCESLNSRIVTVDEAQQLAADEHPNGTRSFTPLTPQLIEEMGI